MYSHSSALHKTAIACGPLTHQLAEVFCRTVRFFPRSPDIFNQTGDRSDCLPEFRLFPIHHCGNEVIVSAPMQRIGAQSHSVPCGSRRRCRSHRRDTGARMPLRRLRRWRGPGRQPPPGQSGRASCEDRRCAGPAAGSGSRLRPAISMAVRRVSETSFSAAVSIRLTQASCATSGGRCVRLGDERADRQHQRRPAQRRIIKLDLDGGTQPLPCPAVARIRQLPDGVLPFIACPGHRFVGGIESEAGRLQRRRRRVGAGDRAAGEGRCGSQAPPAAARS